MIITKLIGGLGNQMFQYAAGRRASYKNNTELKLDITGYDNQAGITPRKYELDIFNINGKIADSNDINKFRNNKRGLQKILTGIYKLIFKKSYFNENGFQFNLKMLQIGDNSYLEGYWVSEKYFEDIRDIIYKEFTFKKKPNEKNKIIINKIFNTSSISLHLRRGDYVTDQKTNQFHGVCDIDYYYKAIKYMGSKIKNPHFFIFSDDMHWVRKNLKIMAPADYIDWNTGNESYEDMRLMSFCKHNIVANSTFSWWGAWLNQNPEKIVIAPKKWFANISINTKDVIPIYWTRF